MLQFYVIVLRVTCWNRASVTIDKGQLTCEGIQNQMVLRDPCYIHVKKVPLYHVIPFIPCLSHFLMLVFLYHVTPILSLR